MAQNVGAVALDIVVGKNEVDGALGKLGGVAGKVGKGIAAGLGVASTAVVAIGKQAIDAYAEYEQLTGGVETLFGDMANSVIENASNAYKTAGMSANAYMQTVTSFSASLLQSLGNDTVKASEKADMAITDMSDNANKMGTSVEMIQNAYQGFAKQNYTMLDNLKLGYGGTKSEMERLLADAEKFSGIKYDISSYADVVDAIHVIQGEMGISGRTAEEAQAIIERTGRSASEVYEQLGTTALEASSTIQGSLSAMGASWTNLLTGLTDPTQDFDRLISNFVDSVGNVATNLVPRLSNVLQGVTNLITQLAPVIVAEIPNLINTLIPPLLDGAIALCNAIITALPELIQMIVSMLPTVIPQLINGVVNMVVLLATNFVQIIQPIIDVLPELIISIVDALLSNLPALIEGSVQLVLGIVNALPQIIMALVNAMPMVITNIITGLIASLPALIMGCIQLVVGIVKALPQIIMGLIQAIPTIIVRIVEALIGASPMLYNGFSNIFTQAWNIICNVFNGAGAWFGSLFTKVVTSIKTAFSTVVGVVGSIFDNVRNKISNVMNSAQSVVKGAIDKIKSFFNFSWSLPKLKLPHFNISGKFSLKPPSVPKFAVEWYSKAMDNGMILDKPTIFGMGSNGNLLGAGEAGSETIVGTNSLLGMIRGAVSSSVNAPALSNVGAGSASSGESKIDRLIELLEKFMGNESNMTVPIYIGNELIDEYIVNKNSRATLRSGGYA
jgi:phage-related protein